MGSNPDSGIVFFYAGFFSSSSGFSPDWVQSLTVLVGMHFSMFYDSSRVRQKESNHRKILIVPSVKRCAGKMGGQKYIGCALGISATEPHLT